MMMKRSLWMSVLLLLGGLTAVAVWVYQSGILLSPEAVARQYVATVYARDYERAYDLIAAADREVKPRQEYLRENASFTGFTLEAARQLAATIEFRDIQVERQGNQATVTAELIVPDGNAEVVREILFAAPNGRDLPEAERVALLEKLDQLQANGQIPTVEGEQTFTLVREGDRWRILENWAEAVRVHFSGEVKYDLPWEFEPVQTVVLAKPGETLQAVYRAKNLSNQPITAKARHIDRPEAYLDYLNIIQCFCLIQQTLQPGEEAELPLVFRVAWDAPAEVQDFYVHYEFYPVELFPEEEGNSGNFPAWFKLP